MKTAIYIEDGVTQVVLTPESDFEKKVITEMAEAKTNLRLFTGSFYDCRGGWVRQSKHFPDAWDPKINDESIMIRLDKEDVSRS
jgi:hypothetical protein